MNILCELLVYVVKCFVAYKLLLKNLVFVN